MAIAERTTIDKAGRVLIPKKVRESAALAPGTSVEARYEDGCIILEAAPSPVRVEKRGRFFVAMPERETPPLTRDAVEATRRRIRRDRGVDEEQ
jgi:AbrB family looped-hinge helix DNA binding protein